MNAPQVPDLRYERKFLVQDLDTGQVRMLVKRHPGIFYERYPPRVVNNLYLDTEEMDNYHANVSGVAERLKVRIRWYGDLFGGIAAPMLEFKVKHGPVGAKYSYPFPGFHLDDGFSQRSFEALLPGSGLPDRVRHRLRFLNVVLANSYHRWYYASRDRRFRITVDTGMTYYRVTKTPNRFRVKCVDRDQVVVELKYHPELDLQAQRVASFFPFSMTKSSKYVTGIERVYF